MLRYESMHQRIAVSATAVLKQSNELTNLLLTSQTDRHIDNVETDFLQYYYNISFASFITERRHLSIVCL